MASMPSSAVPPISPGRSKASNGSTTNPSAQSRARIMMCTHMTMVRMYTQDMRCSLCLQPGPFGWIYRCTQDRELMIEDGYANGDKNLFDDPFESFAVSEIPKKRSPAARANPLSFLEEMTPEQLNTYTPQQISMIFQQREHVLEVSKRQAKEIELLRQRENTLLEASSSSIPDLAIGSPDGSTQELDKYWVPKPHQECQFKACHRCRHTSSMRAFLSLDGIVNGDIPMTAVSGFGFDLYGQRPIILRKQALNFGMRPNPEPRASSSIWMNQGLGLGIRALPPIPDITTESEQAQTINSPFNDKIDADTTFGQSAHSYDSAAMTRSFNIESSTSKLTAFEVIDRKKLRHLLKSNVKFAAGNVKLDDPEEFSLLPYVRSAETPPNTPRSGGSPRSSGPARGRSDKSLRNNHELRSSLNLDEVTDETEHDPEVLHDLDPNRASSPRSKNELDAFTEVSLTTSDGSATEMDLCEESVREFGADPLVIGNDIALTEEPVQMHMHSIMAQS